MQRPILACACAGALLLAATTTALAGSDDGGGGGGNDDVIRALSCSGGSTGKLKLGREDGARVEAEFELEHVSAGRRWRIQLRHGSVLVTDVVRTSTATGRIELRRLLADRAGADRVSVVAQRLPSGQRCTATAVAP
jgi:hypothetical protein